MKGLFKKVFLLVTAAFLCVSVAACTKKDPAASTPTGTETGTQDAQGYVSTADYKAYIKVDLGDVLKSVGDLDEFDTDVKNAIQKAYNDGLTAIDAAQDTATAKAAFDAAKAAMIAAIPTANGVMSYASLPNSEKTKILGVLEAYAVRNGITGISLFEDGGYVMYSDRVTLGTENYIPGYGFGTLAEGSINADMANETNAAWKRYYHSFESSDPGSANYLNDKGSQIGDIYGYFAASYFTTFMNATKDGYDWVPELADAKPIAVNPDEATGMATKWKFPVKTGAELKYTTNSTIASRAAFNNREVAIEDYVTPFKILLTQANGYARGQELAKTKSGAIVGASAYYDASKNGYNEAAWEGVGIKSYVEEGQGWFEYEFTTPQTQFYSMYYISSSLYQPIPQEFFDLVGKDAYCGYDTFKRTSPVDNSLALGAYALESWETDKAIVFKKNPNYVYADTKFSIPGVHLQVLTAAETDPNAGIKEFIAGNLDSTGIPQEYLKDYKNDPRTRNTTGSSNFKLNVNATDAKTWEYLFGENGVVTQTPKDEYWEVEPALSNPHFVRALSLAIDRVTYADKRGSIPSVDYLSSNYMSDPENGISYSTTAEHKEAVSALLRDTDGYGFSLQNSREYFKLALQELVDAGLYQPGTKENPTVIELEIAWMRPAHEENYHKEIEQFLETAFNHESVSGGKFKLDVKFWVGADWSDVYYKKLMIGQYDLGFGSISGNALNPLDFLSVLSADPVISGEFTLNWGTDTNDPTADVLVYNGMQWSFDALWSAANTSACVVNDGKLVSVFDSATLVSEADNADGTHTVVIDVKFNEGEGYSGEVVDLVLFGCDDTTNYTDYNEYSVLEQATSEVLADGTVRYTVVLTTEDVEAFGSKALAGIDVYYLTDVNGGIDENLSTLYVFGDAE